jgi:hypothetical protein
MSVSYSALYQMKMNPVSLGRAMFRMSRTRESGSLRRIMPVAPRMIVDDPNMFFRLPHL